MTTPAPYVSTPQNRIASNRRQQAKLCWKRKQMIDLADTIATNIKDMGFTLPAKAADYETYKWGQLEEMGYDVQDNEFRGQWSDDWDELTKLYYSIKRTNKAVYAVFEENGQTKPMLLSAWYNKHRFDMVWLWRKSQLIRSIYRKYLSENEHIIRNCHPVHMVLTVPHPDGLFAGKRFYARELLGFFHEMRRTPFWKKHVYGGEYGLEIKKSKTNGLHIHTHSLLFLKKGISVNEFREWLRDKWSDLTGGCMVHAETLFFYKRKDNGQYITEQARKRNKHGEWEDLSTVQVRPAGEYYNQETGEWEEQDEQYQSVPVERRKKHYVTTESSLDEYLQGVLECIKYHFKHDAAEDENGEWDLPLMRDILNNSKRLRFYSRFGAFYKEKALCFDRLDTVTDEEIEGLEEDINGSAYTAEKELVNPFTEALAVPGSYRLAVATPERLKYSGKNDLTPYSLLTYGTDEFTWVQDMFTLKDVITSMCRGEIYRVLKHNRKQMFK